MLKIHRFFISDSKPAASTLSESSENLHGIFLGPYLSYAESPANFVVKFRFSTNFKFTGFDFDEVLAPQVFILAYLGPKELKFRSAISQFFTPNYLRNTIVVLKISSFRLNFCRIR